MPVQVLIPAPMRTFTNQQARVSIDGGATVGEVLAALAEQYPGIGERIFESEGRVRRFVNVYLNDEDVRFLGGLETEVSDGDNVTILPAVAGG